jgi:hypothetical protein
VLFQISHCRKCRLQVAQSTCYLLQKVFFHYYLFVFVFCFLLVLVGFELKVLSLLGRHSITWATPPALFALVILEMGKLFAQADLYLNLPI